MLQLITAVKEVNTWPRVLALDTSADKSSLFFLDATAKSYCVYFCASFRV